MRELQMLWDGAGRPPYRQVSKAIRDNDQMPDTVSHETVSALLQGVSVPRWSKVECVVRQLALMSVIKLDPDAKIDRFLQLWTSADDDRTDSAASSPTTVESNANPPSPLLPSRQSGDGQSGSVPLRHPGFTGRDDLFSVIQARLEGDPWRPVVLHGFSGVGKTSTAVEYVHREQGRYDLIWWIAAEQPAQARAALVALGERQELLTSQDMRQTIRSVLVHLESADFRWLLVFDNAAGSDEIAALLPAAGGAVIVTTRDAVWLDRGRAVPVNVLPRKDSIRLLQRGGGITFDEADQLAAYLGDLPLALEQAAAMRAETGITVADYLRRLDEDAYAVLDIGRPADYPATVAGAFRFAFTRLRRERPAAAQLLEVLACLSAEPIALTFLRSSGDRLVPPPLGRLLQRDERLDEAVHLLRRYGLLATVDGGQGLQVHRLVQLIVRDHLLTERERERAYTNASLLLVAANPGDPNDQISWEMHKEISPHVRPARLIARTDSAVRRVVLDQARFLYLSGDFSASLRLAEEALKAWAGPAGAWDIDDADGAWNDDDTFACLNRIATALGSLGRYQEAGDLAERILNRLNGLDAFGPDHPRTAGVANTVAYARRALGYYVEALRLDQYRIEFCTRQGLRPELQRARSNLAVGLRATGNFEQAFKIDEALVEERTEELGAEHYLTLFSASNLARDLYGLGRYADALRLQQNSLPALRARLGAHHQQVMWATRTVALCLRKTGRLDEALDQSDSHFHTCSDEFGAEHADALAACMTYVNTIRAIAAADPAAHANLLPAAYNLSLFAVSAYRRVFNERNPLTLAAATNQAAILRAMGQRGRARITAQAAYHGLEPLGSAHPYTQAAAIGLASDLVAAHEGDEAVRLLRTVLSTTSRTSRNNHPDVLICAMNLALITHSLEDDEVRRRLRALQQALGPDHPDALAAGRGLRIECDIEPPPF